MTTLLTAFFWASLGLTALILILMIRAWITPMPKPKRNPFAQKETKRTKMALKQRRAYLRILEEGRA